MPPMKHGNTPEHAFGWRMRLREIIPIVNAATTCKQLGADILEYFETQGAVDPASRENFAEIASQPDSILDTCKDYIILIAVRNGVE